MTPHEPHPGAGAERGIMVVVVGPSGAGKDTLMNLAARHFSGRADVHFTRRVITRHRAPAARTIFPFPSKGLRRWSSLAPLPSGGKRMV